MLIAMVVGAVLTTIGMIVFVATRGGSPDPFDPGSSAASAPADPAAAAAAAAAAYKAAGGAATGSAARRALAAGANSGRAANSGSGTGAATAGSGAGAGSGAATASVGGGDAAGSAAGSGGGPSLGDAAGSGGAAGSGAAAGAAGDLTKPRPVPPRIRRAVSDWRSGRSWRRRRAARAFSRYLLRRPEAHGAALIGRLYLQQRWASDGLRALEKAFAADPSYRPDPITLVAVCFVYSGSSAWRAERILRRFASPRRRRALLLIAAIVVQRSKGLRARLRRAAAALRPAGTDALLAHLSTTAEQRNCPARRRAFGGLLPYRKHELVHTLALYMRNSRCVGVQASALLAAR